MTRRNDPWDKPWVAIATVGGIIAVVIMALAFFMGGGNTGGHDTSGKSTISQAQQEVFSSPAPTTAVLGITIKPESVKEVPAVTVPLNGVFVRVDYIGGFAGTYGINGNMLTVRNSGERVFPLNATTGAVSATFHKEDGSTRHEIVVEIYKDGKVLRFARNSSAYGEVSVDYQV